jgi:hypothetical protein
MQLRRRLDAAPVRTVRHRGPQTFCGVAKGPTCAGPISLLAAPLWNPSRCNCLVPRIRSAVRGRSVATARISGGSARSVSYARRRARRISTARRRTDAKVEGTVARARVPNVLLTSHARAETVSSRVARPTATAWAAIASTIAAAARSVSAASWSTNRRSVGRVLVRRLSPYVRAVWGPDF